MKRIFYLELKVKTSPQLSPIQSEREGPTLAAGRGPRLNPWRWSRTPVELPGNRRAAQACVKEEVRETETCEQLLHQRLESRSSLHLCLTAALT